MVNMAGSNINSRTNSSWLISSNGLEDQKNTSNQPTKNPTQRFDNFVANKLAPTMPLPFIKTNTRKKKKQTTKPTAVVYTQTDYALKKDLFRC